MPSVSSTSLPPPPDHNPLIPALLSMPAFDPWDDTALIRAWDRAQLEYKLFHSEYAEEYITQLQNQGKHSELAEFGITRPTTTNNTNDINKKRKRRENDSDTVEEIRTGDNNGVKNRHEYIVAEKKGKAKPTTSAERQGAMSSSLPPILEIYLVDVQVSIRESAARTGREMYVGRVGVVRRQRDSGANARCEVEFIQEAKMVLLSLNDLDVIPPIKGDRLVVTNDDANVSSGCRGKTGALVGVDGKDAIVTLDGNDEFRILPMGDVGRYVEPSLDPPFLIEEPLPLPASTTAEIQEDSLITQFAESTNPDDLYGQGICHGMEASSHPSPPQTANPSSYPDSRPSTKGPPNPSDTTPASDSDSVPIPPIPTNQSEIFNNMLMSWYYAGYYTALYTQQQQQK